MTYSVVGQSLPHTDAPEKVTGRARFGADILLPGMLEGRILRSPHPHARILAIDTSRAERLPGVKAIVTARDTPGTRLGPILFDRPIIAIDRVRYIGEPVAVVAASDADTAEEALGLIQVNYEPLPGLFDPLEAMKPESPILHPELASYKAELHLERFGNVCSYFVVKRGDVEEAFHQAHLVLEDRFQTVAVHQGYIQPHAAVAATDLSGKLTVWSSTKGPFRIREETAEALQIPMSRIRVISAAVGGDFGGKGPALIEPLCALLALKSGRPVRIEMSRAEEFVGACVRHPSRIELKYGFLADGTFLAAQGRMIKDTGAYGDTGPRHSRSAVFLQGPYNAAHALLEGYIVYTNNTICGNCRAPTGPQTMFAVESMMDMAARRLGMDPVELRLKNAVEEGDSSAGGLRLWNVGLKKTLQQAADYLRRAGPITDKDRGRGMACAQWSLHGGGLGPSSACVRINEDGTAVLLTGAADQGAGAYTVLPQIVAEVLGLPLGDVALVAADTDATPYESPTGGSRATYRDGRSVKMAAEDAKRQLLRLAAQRLEANPEDLELAQRRIYVKGSPEHGLPIAEVARLAQNSAGGPIIGTGALLREEEMQHHELARSVDAPAYGTQVAEVEVDPETGQVRVLDYFACHDTGFTINPMSVEGQVEGGIVFGMGQALTEAILWEQGRPLNPNLLDYKMPTALDAPQRIQISLVEEASDLGPFGAKGVGEPPTIPVPAAIANAVYDAVGVRIKELPITAEKIVQALNQKQQARRSA